MKQIFTYVFVLIGFVLQAQEMDFDSGFGASDAGTTYVQFGSDDDIASGMLMGGDGGTRYICGSTLRNNNWDFALTYFYGPGEIIGGYGSDGMGKVAFDLGGDDHAMALANGTAPWEYTYLAGYSTINGATTFALAAFTQQGEIQTPFGTSGKVLTSMGTIDDRAYAVIVQTNGKILVAGYTTSVSTGTDFAMVRYNTDGTLDTSFGVNGK